MSSATFRRVAHDTMLLSTFEKAESKPEHSSLGHYTLNNGTYLDKAGPDMLHFAILSTKDTKAFEQTIVIEDDCACPAKDTTLFPQRIPNSTSALSKPALYTNTLGPDTHLVFNPLGSAGVVVLNNPAWELLNAFQMPRVPNEVLADLGCPLEEGRTAVQQLTALELLVAVGNTPVLQPASPQTLTVWLHTTNACNLSCPYCYVSKSDEAMSLEIGEQAIAAVFRSAVQHQFQRVKLKYAGGEATLNFRAIMHLHDYAQQLAQQHRLVLDGVVLSNGVAITERMIEAFQNRQLRLMISLDGLGAAHDAHRPFINGQGSFKQVERTLERLRRMAFTPSVSITVSNANLEGLPTTVDFLLDRELPFTLNFYRENECSVSFADLAYDEAHIIAAMQAVFAIIERKLPPYSLLGALVDRAQLDALHNRPCGVGQSYFAVNQQGRIAKCHMLLEQSVGTVFATDPLKLIQLDMSGLQNPVVDEKEGCKACTWRYWCAGGCPALTYRATGRFDVKSPNCHIYQALFPEVLRLEGLRLLKYSHPPC